MYIEIQNVIRYLRNSRKHYNARYTSQLRFKQNYAYGARCTLSHRQTSVQAITRTMIPVGSWPDGFYQFQIMQPTDLTHLALTSTVRSRNETDLMHVTSSPASYCDNCLAWNKLYLLSFILICERGAKALSAGCVVKVSWEEKASGRTDHIAEVFQNRGPRNWLADFLSGIVVLRGRARRSSPKGRDWLERTRLTWKDERGSPSIRRTVELFQRWPAFGKLLRDGVERIWSFRAHRCHWTEPLFQSNLVLFARVVAAAGNR